MISSSVGELAKACGGCLFGVDENIVLNNVVINDSEAEENSCFAALCGEHHDGNEYSAFALGAGATAVLTDKKDKAEKHPSILVESVPKALLSAAEYYREKELKTLIAISGSVGKTTVKDLTYSILKERSRVLKTKENRNNLIGAPVTVLENRGAEIAVIEAGISIPGEMDMLGKMLKPDVAVITNIENMHAQTLGSKENTAREKLKLLNYVKNGGRAVLLYDEPLLRNAERGDLNITFVSESDRNADFSLANCVTSAFGTSFDVMQKNEVLYKDIRLSLIGKHNAINALFAIAAAGDKVSEDDIRHGLKNAEMSKMRQKVIKTDEKTILLDTYNAGPRSCKAALDIFSELCKAEKYKKKVIALGSMLELGDLSEREHYLLGSAVARVSPDTLIIYGSEARPLARGAEEGGMRKERIAFFEDDEKEQAKALFENEVKEGAVILLKGSRAMKMEEFVEYERNM